MSKPIIKIKTNKTRRFYGWEPDCFIAKGEDGNHICLLTAYPDNCSIVILSSIGGILKEELDVLIEELEDDACAITSGPPTVLQVTTNNKDDLKIFLSCNFEVIQTYTSRGSGNEINILSYTY